MMPVSEYIFRAGRKSPPAVKSASAAAPNRCNSDTDSIVWMEEDAIIGVLYALGVFSEHIFIARWQL